MATVSKDALKAIYGAADDVVLYWAHHEKLLVIDHDLVFMGGLDLCMHLYCFLTSAEKLFANCMFRLRAMGYELCVLAS